MRRKSLLTLVFKQDENAIERQSLAMYRCLRLKGRADLDAVTLTNVIGIGYGVFEN